MSDCNHVWRREQHYDECIKCGAHWSPEHGFNVPMRTDRRPSPLCSGKIHHGPFSFGCSPGVVRCDNCGKRID